MQYYLEGQNCTSSTVSSCPWNIPRGPTDGLSAGLSVPSLELGLDLMIDPLDPEVLVVSESMASVDI